MKKIYAMMAMALVAGATASADKYDLGVARSLATSTVEMKTAVTPESDGRIKAAANPEANYFMWDSSTLYQSGSESGSIQVQINGTEAIVTGLFELQPLTGTYNASAGTITLPEQETFYSGRRSQNDPTSYPIWFMPAHILVDNAGHITGNQPLAALTLQYAPQGVELNTGEVTCVGGWFIQQGLDLIWFALKDDKGSSEFSGFAANYNNFFPTVEEVYPETPAFVYDASEWTFAGKATLEDGWFRAMDGVGFNAYEVDVRVNKTTPTDILLMNPYGTGTPYATAGEAGNQTPEAEGFIYLNVENPECVLVRPFVNSGFGNEDYVGGGNVCCMNKEGYDYYLDGYDFADIIEEAEMYEDVLSTMDENYVVNIPNCRIQYPSGLRTYTQWMNSEQKPIPMETIINLPETAFVGVEAIVDDAANGVKRYFNLQGMEVVNPEAGQVVIVREGNKSSKTIVR